MNIEFISDSQEKEIEVDELREIIISSESEETEVDKKRANSRMQERPGTMKLSMDYLYEETVKESNRLFRIK